MDTASSCLTTGAAATQAQDFLGTNQQPLALLDFFFPGFSMLSGAMQKYVRIDLNVYLPLILLVGGLTFLWQYFTDYLWAQIETYFMSTVDIRTDDEIYNWIMGWVAAQRFSQRSRRFVANTNLNSRSWFLWRWEDDAEEEDGSDEDTLQTGTATKKLSYTPTFGSHYFWYRGRLLIFRRMQDRQQASMLVASEREEISVSCFGRNPWILKELLLEARALFLKRDDQKTLIYRGTVRAGSTEPTWQRCMARTARPFSTVILNEKVKEDLVNDVTDYLDPSTRRWYSNRGIPYRRGYLLYGPPGTGKSSLSLALAGFFKMRIYIVSLSSPSGSEEHLATLFAELPRRCVVLLEDIDSAGLTHTREETKVVSKTEERDENDEMVPGQITNGNRNSSRLSLSGLLNILDGVASQEGRVLIMTTNHIEKLDKALIRPGRVDMVVKFDLADQGMISAIFRAIFAPLEGDEVPQTPKVPNSPKTASVDPEEAKKRADEEVQRKAEITAKVDKLAEEFAAKVPAHEFSPAELQGFLMKNKRDPEAAVANIKSWVEETRKEKKEKELKEAEEKRLAEEREKKEKEEEEKRRKKEEEEAEKEKKREEKQKEKKRRRKAMEKAIRKARQNLKSYDTPPDSNPDSLPHLSSDEDSSDSGPEDEKSEASKNKDTTTEELKTQKVEKEDGVTEQREQAPQEIGVQAGSGSGDSML